MRISMATFDPEACHYSTNSVYGSHSSGGGGGAAREDRKPAPSPAAGSGQTAPDLKDLEEQVRREEERAKALERELKLAELQERLREAKQRVQALERQLKEARKGRK